MLKVLSLLKRNKALASAFVLVLSAAFVFGMTSGLYVSDLASPSEDVSLPSQFAPAPDVADETAGESDSEMPGFGLYIDGAFIAANEDRSVIASSIETYTSRYASALGVEKNSEINLLNKIEIISGEYATASFADADKLLKCLGIKSKYALDYKVRNVYGVVVECSMKLSAKVEKEETLAYPTRNIYTDFGSKNKVTELNKGEDGLSKNVYECTYVGGKLTDSLLISCYTLVPATERVVLINTGATMTSAAFEGFLELPYKNGRITSLYGSRSLGYHNGIDIISTDGSCYGDDVLSAADGVVTFVDKSGYSDYGKRIEIAHDNGIVTLYAHLSAVDVNVGDEVKVGDVIGKVGNTGFSTGPHLHFEVRIDGIRVDPELFVTYPHFIIED